ncbi:MAG: polyprenyl synthetase family protein [Candidatus Gastranaerophilales bacterium]|nr:polyprenyl synthetase family protein [Candidatus Gastranaerophilales bacterium]
MNKYIELVDKKLDEYMPVEYPENIFKSMKYTVTLPGKRLRPVMCLETCKIMGGDINDALPTACAIEMLHAQSLIHDDLPCMDNDDFRRGKPSNHKVFGEAIAVLAGDALLSFAPQIIIEKSTTLSADTLVKVLHEFVVRAGAYRLIGGQVVDIESEGVGVNKGENISCLSEEDKKKTLEFIHTHKTADLFKLALRTGAMIAGAVEEQLEEMEEFGQKFGLAFQIYDDIMDEISTFEELGKTIGKDKESGKLTYVSLYGLEAAKDKVHSLIADCHSIIDKYHSDIFTSMLDKILEKIDR